MKYPLFYAFLFSFALLFAGCKGGSASNQLDEVDKQALETLDSLSTELDKSIETLDSKTKEMEDDVDEILKELD